MSKSTLNWVATVTYREPGGKVRTRVAIYPLSYRSDGKPVQLDRTVVIRDLVPRGCTTTKISIRKQRF